LTVNANSRAAISKPIRSDNFRIARDSGTIGKHYATSGG
jgi:hypothetical protein